MSLYHDYVNVFKNSWLSKSKKVDQVCYNVRWAVLKLCSNIKVEWFKWFLYIPSRSVGVLLKLQRASNWVVRETDVGRHVFVTLAILCQ